MLFKRFLKNTSGNIAVMFSLALVPILVAGGVAIDSVRRNGANESLQAATDAAALAAVSSKKNSLDAAKIEALVNSYLAQNKADDIVKSVKVKDFGLDKNNIYHVKVTGKIDTMLMGLVGINTMDVGSYSEVDPGTVPTLEMAMVLDVTGSMNAEGRLDALKVAAKDLTNKLLGSGKPAGSDVKIGIVPFARHVNVGVGNLGSSWLDVPPMPKTWQCWDNYPVTGTFNCRQVANGPVDGITQPGTHQECDYTYGPAEKVCNWQQQQWLGVVGSRNAGLDTKLQNGGQQYPGLLDTWGPQPITDLTADKTIVDQAIDSLTAIDETYIPTGLMWGWELLDSGKPFTVAKTKGSMKGLGGIKALVLMTDGDNTVSVYQPYQRGVHYGVDGAEADAKTKELCENIKKGDITVFTVAFKVTQASTLKMLNDCASNAGQAFDANDNQSLLDAFGKIADSLSAMRLAK